ncbi:hypothetical protein PIB30_062714 [Stylosanthes scabra]|uniref:Uncharacterized protein n=1 Tax=Stylosanthes scabra TaxID=79078 RepID=A0ABU6TMW3_9FABA|nr:hypothetical protein [Stylosanthes scabra]
MVEESIIRLWLVWIEWYGVSSFCFSNSPVLQIQQLRSHLFSLVSSCAMLNIVAQFSETVEECSDDWRRRPEAIGGFVRSSFLVILFSFLHSERLPATVILCRKNVDDAPMKMNL